MSDSPNIRFWTRLGQSNDARASFSDDDQSSVLDSVREHLGWLLNTRRGDAPACPDYGLPDLSGVVAGLPSSERSFYTAIEKSILDNEPRLSWVRVRLSEQNHPGEVYVKFNVDVLLKSDSRTEKQRLSAEVDIDSIFDFSGY